MCLLSEKKPMGRPIRRWVGYSERDFGYLGLLGTWTERATDRVRGKRMVVVALGSRT